MNIIALAITIGIMIGIIIIPIPIGKIILYIIDDNSSNVTDNTQVLWMWMFGFIFVVIIICLGFFIHFIYSSVLHWVK